MIVSIAIVVLPVWRSPMISWRWPRPIGVSESIALSPVCMRLVDALALHHRRRLQLQRRGARRSRSRRGRRSGCRAGRRRGRGRRRRRAPRGPRRCGVTGWPSSMPEKSPRMTTPISRMSRFSAMPERAVLELQQLVGHGRGQALDAGDAVHGLGDGADLFAARCLRLVVGDEALERLLDLLRPDRELRHVRLPLLSWLRLCLVSSGADVCRMRVRPSTGQPSYAGPRLPDELPLRLGEPGLDAGVDQVVADHHPHATEHVGVDHDVEVHLAGSTWSASALVDPGALVVVRRSGDPGGRDQALAPGRERRLVVREARGQANRAGPTTTWSSRSLVTLPTLRPSSPSSSDRLPSTRRRAVGQRVAQVGVRRRGSGRSGTARPRRSSSWPDSLGRGGRGDDRAPPPGRRTR